MNLKNINTVQRVKILQLDDPKPQNSLKFIVHQQKETQFSIQPSQGSFDNDLEQEETLSVENNMDDSLEMAMMEQTIDMARIPNFQKEKDITQYLKNKGVKIKTDPRSKQDKYFVQNKRRQQKALTTIYVQPCSKQQKQLNVNYLTPNVSSRFMDLQNNQIMQRRTPTSSPLSQSLSESKSLIINLDPSKKSKFSMIQK